MREQAARTASALLDEDERVAIVLADISERHFQDAIVAHPDRAVNLGIMEATAVGVAAGFAMEGFHPITLSIGPFITERPYEQLKLDFGYQELGGTFVSVGASYDYSTEGSTHHGPSDIQVLSAIPGFQLLVPGHRDEVDRLIRSTYANGSPTYVRASTAENANPYEVTVGRIEVVRRGAGATVLAVGPMLDRTMAAVEAFDVSVLYVTTVEPFDADSLQRIAGDHPHVIVVEPFFEGTMARSVAAALHDRPSRIASIGVPRRFIRGYGTLEEFDHDLGLDEAGIRQRISGLLGD